VALACLAIYLVVLVALAFLPPTDWALNSPLRVNLNPFASIWRGLHLGPASQTFWQVVGNVAAFVPLGLLVPLVRPRSSWLTVLVAATGLSVAIELGQFAVSLAVGYGYRAVDVDDVILNVLGGMVGYLGWLVARRLFTPRSRAQT
jgi:glycopeptide antibiotics resistance protein